MDFGNSMTKRTPGRHGHYFLSYSEEYPDDIKVKTKFIHSRWFKKRRKRRKTNSGEVKRRR